MNWIVILQLLPYIIQILQIILGNLQATMFVQEWGGDVKKLPCKIERVGFRKVKITAKYNATSIPITGASIVLSNGKVFAVAELNDKFKYFVPGEVELGDTF